jgi:hypothetical protein
LVDAYHVPKLLSQQLLPFGRSGDGLERLTFEVEQVADSPRRASSSRILCVLARLRFRSMLVLSFGWKWFRTVCSSGRTVRGCLADSPRAPRGRSVIQGRLWRFWSLFRTVRGAGPDSPWCGCRRSAAAGRTVRVARVDSPPRLAGQSARG